MHLIKLAAALLLPLSSLAARSSGKDAYSTFAKKAQSTPNLKLDDSSFVKLTTSPRNHSAAVLLTALDPRVGCALCRDFQPEWDILARSWVHGDAENEGRLFFGTLDFAEGRQTFASFQLTTAPVLFLFHPTDGPHAKGDGQPVRLDFSSGPQNADSLHAWLARQLPDIPHPPVKRPINWARIATVTTGILGLVTAVTVGYKYLVPIISNRNIWAAGSLLAILLFTSGHMFNHIRGTPYVAGDGQGGIQYFTSGFQNQLGLESQIIAALYGALSFATITLALKVPRMTNPRTQQVAVFVWGGVIFVVYSLLLSIFRIKNAGYPFWLPPF